MRNNPESMGTKVNAANNENNTEADNPIPISKNNCPASPLTKIIGANTATVVKVEANIAPPTSSVPSIAAFTGDLPICM